MTVDVLIRNPYGSRYASLDVQANYLNPQNEWYKGSFPSKYRDDRLPRTQLKCIAYVWPLLNQSPDTLSVIRNLYDSRYASLDVQTSILNPKNEW